MKPTKEAEAAATKKKPVEGSGSSWKIPTAGRYRKYPEASADPYGRIWKKKPQNMR